MIRLIFDKNDFEGQNCAVLYKILKQLKGQKYFMAIFVVLWSYLLTTKLSCLQKNNFGDTKYSTWCLQLWAEAAAKLLAGTTD